MNGIGKLTDSEKIHFSETFLEKFLQNGFGTLPKREIEILIFHLLYKNSSFFHDKSNYEMANLLKISESRIKSLKAEANLKYQRVEFKDALREIAEDLFVKKTIHYESYDDIIQFYLEDPALMREFEFAVKQLGYSTDTSFNREIVKVKNVVFLDIFIKNFDDTESKFLEIAKEKIKHEKDLKRIIDKSIPRLERLKSFMNDYSVPISIVTSLLSFI